MNRLSLWWLQSFGNLLETYLLQLRNSSFQSSHSPIDPSPKQTIRQLIEGSDAQWPWQRRHSLVATFIAKSSQIVAVHMVHWFSTEQANIWLLGRVASQCVRSRAFNLTKALRPFCQAHHGQSRATAVYCSFAEQAGKFFGKRTAKCQDQPGPWARTQYMAVKVTKSSMKVRKQSFIVRRRPAFCGVKELDSDSIETNRDWPFNRPL